MLFLPFESILISLSLLSPCIILLLFICNIYYTSFNDSKWCKRRKRKTTHYTTTTTVLKIERSTLAVLCSEFLLSLSFLFLFIKYYTTTTYIMVCWMVERKGLGFRLLLPLPALWKRFHHVYVDWCICKSCFTCNDNSIFVYRIESFSATTSRNGLAIEN